MEENTVFYDPEEEGFEAIPEKSELQEEQGIILWTSKAGEKAFVSFKKPVTADQVIKLAQQVGIKAELLTDHLSDPKTRNEAVKNSQALMIANQGDISRTIFDIDFQENRKKYFRFFNAAALNLKTKKLPRITIIKDTVLAFRRDQEEVEAQAKILNVFGRISNVQSEIINVKLGEGFEANEEGEIFATLSGYLKYEFGVISIDPTLRIVSQDEAYESHVKFIGSVEVGHDVLVNFDITAGQNIMIKGCADSAILYAGEDITVGEGILGEGKSYVEAKQNLKARYANQANVVCDQNCELGSGCYHANVECYGELTMPSGTIVGGEVYGAYGITAKEIGTNKGVKTVVAVGFWNKMPKSFDVAEEELEGVIEKLNEAMPLVQPLLEKKKSGKPMSPEQEARSQQFFDMMKELYEKKNQLTEWLEGHDIEKCETAKIEISRAVHPGVTILINNVKMEVKEKIRRATFRLDEAIGEIVISH